MATVHETYAAAIQHDRAGLPAGTRLVGVVRRPMGWFHGAVDENVPALGPPGELLDDIKERQATLEAEGMADAEAVERAWADVDFGERYHEYLETDAEAGEAFEALVDEVVGGTDVAVVCYEAPDKPCHRHLLRERLLDRLDGR
ncbi:MAG: DUF488 family protein [Halobacteriales archaeon]|nr:DUF488 family protein [Halobacteriales archaeon]